jgi:hypothetical protein
MTAPVFRARAALPGSPGEQPQSISVEGYVALSGRARSHGRRRRMSTNVPLWIVSTLQAKRQLENAISVLLTPAAYG